MWNGKSLLNQTPHIRDRSEPVPGMVGVEGGEDNLPSLRRREPVPSESREAGGEVLTLDDLAAGQRAIISCVQCPQLASCERLMAYGLTQGQSVFLVQKHPAFVIRVDETELALDEFVARCIQVLPSEL